MQNIEKLKPTGLFTNYIYKAIPLAFDESMSYYETLCGLLHYLKNTVIPTVNNNADAMIELQNLYTELHDYVEHYFDNLDVQEEINNKLDEMAESGQLTDIIAQYLGLAGMITFNNVAEMKLAENLVNGSKCATLGYYSVNDGGKALYKIRTITNEDVVDDSTIIALYDNTLIAELVTDKSVKIRQLGAKGNGTDDDTTKLQIALNKFDEIDLQIGNYLISDTLLINSTAKHIKGSDIVGLSSIQGLGKTNIMVSMNDIGIKVNNTTGQNFQGCYFEGFSIYATNDAVEGTNAIGIDIDNWNHCTLKNVGIYNFQGNIGLKFQHYGQYSYVSNCKFADCKYCVYIPDSYPGIHFTNCMFDGNRNGSDFNQNPREGSYAIYTNGGGQIIDTCRFQGFETCIYSNGVQNVITHCRFEMFNYGIIVNDSRNVIDVGNTFDRYMGTTATKIAVQINSQANNTVVEPLTATSCQPVPVVNQNASTIRNDITNFNLQLGTISDECDINLCHTSYQGLMSRLSIMVSNETVVGNSVTDYWIISCGGWSSYWESTNKGVIKNTVYNIVPQATGTSGTARTDFRLIFRKHGNPGALENLLVTGQIEKY